MATELRVKKYGVLGWLAQTTRNELSESVTMSPDVGLTPKVIQLCDNGDTDAGNGRTTRVSRGGK